MEGKLLSYDTIHDYIYHYKNQVLYNGSYNWAPIINGHMLTPERRYYYFVYTQGKPFGYLYDTSKKYYAKKMPVDSMLNHEKSYVGVTSEPSLDTLISETFKKDSGILERIYTTRGIGKDSTLNGTQYLYYSNKLNDLQYTMSRQYDTVKGVRLFKSYIINNPRYLPEYKLTLDRIDQLFFIERLTIDNEKELMKYFEEDQRLNQSK